MAIGHIGRGGASVFSVTDMAILRNQQWQGIGDRVMDTLLGYIDDANVPSA